MKSKGKAGGEGSAETPDCQACSPNLSSLQSSPLPPCSYRLPRCLPLKTSACSVSLVELVGWPTTAR